MISAIKDLFEHRLAQKGKTGHSGISERDIRLATAALLIETASSDFHFDQTELIKLKQILVRVYRLSDHQVAQLIEQAQGQVEHSVSLDQFSRLLDRSLTQKEKYHLLELLWEVAYADGRVDKYEEYLIRKLSDLLHVSHKAYITSKLKVGERVKEHDDNL